MQLIMDFHKDIEEHIYLLIERVKLKISFQKKIEILIMFVTLDHMQELDWIIMFFLLRINKQELLHTQSKVFGLIKTLLRKL